MTRRFSLLPALAAAILSLAGCDAGIRSDAGDGLEEGRRLTAAERVRMRAVQRGEILREERPFYGTAVEVERGAVSGTPLPRTVEGARGVSLSLSGQAGVESVAAAITAATDIPVNIRTRYVLPDGSAVRVPIGTTMTVRAYEGPLSAFLDRLAARMDVAWTYDGKVVTIDRMARRTWRVALPFGSTEMTDSASLANGTVSVTTLRSIDPWQDLQIRLAALAPPPAQVTLSPQRGRVEALGPPSVLAALDAVIRDVADVASMRIGLEVAVYFVDSDRADEFGIGLQSLFNGLGSFKGRDIEGSVVLGDGVDGLDVDTEFRETGGERNESITLAPVGQAGGIVLSRGSAFVSFETLARDRAVVDYRLATSVAQSGVVTPIRITRERNYVRSKTIERDGRGTGEDGSGNGSDAGRVTYVIDTMETGLSVTALPRLIDGRQIQLSLVLNQRAGEIRDIEGAEGIQSPDIDNREIRNSTVLAPGETLVLSGYEQDVAVRGDSGVGFLRRIGLGGKSEASRRKVRMIVLVRPTLISGRGGRA